MGDGLAEGASCADGHDVVPTAEVDVLDGDVHAEDLVRNGLARLSANHGVQAGELLVVVVAIDGGLLASASRRLRLRGVTG